MARDFNGSGFSSANRFVEQEDADPRVGLVNLADVMLVFACGLMLALVVNWNIELPDVQELDKSTMQEVNDVEKITGEITSSTNPYMELGKVYQDPATGKLYMMTEEATGEGGGSSDGEAQGTADTAASDAATSGGSSEAGASEGGSGNATGSSDSGGTRGGSAYVAN